MEIRTDILKKEEYQTAIDLLGALYLELGEEAGSITFLNDKLVNEVSASGRTTIYLVRSGAQTLGLFTLTESQAIYAGGRYGVLDEMYIIPAFRSRSVGKSVIQNIKNIAAHKQWKRVDVTAPTSNSDRVVQFYQSCGFVFTGPKLKLYLFGS